MGSVGTENTAIRMSLEQPQFSLGLHITTKDETPVGRYDTHFDSNI